MSAPRSGPLAGVRVVDFATALAAPKAAEILAGQGADVIKIEAPAGDQARWSGTRAGDISALFHMSNRGKRGITLDLKTEAGRRVAHRIAARADIVFQNFRPSVASRLGVSYEQLRELNPGIIVVAVTGFGPTGPDAARPAFDSVIQAESGFADLQRHPDGTPRLAEHTIADKVTALAAAQAAVAALYARERAGGGQLVEVPMLDVSVDFLWTDVAGNETLLDAPPSAARGVTAGQRFMLELADGWLTVSLGRPGSVPGLCRVLGIDVERYRPLIGAGNAAAASPALFDEFVARVRASAATRLRDETARELLGNDVTVGVIRSLAELPAGPQLVAAGLFRETHQPGVGRIRHPRPPVRFSAYPPVEPGVGPRLGEHTGQILAELGLGAEAESLRAAGAFGPAALRASSALATDVTMHITAAAEPVGRPAGPIVKE